MIRHLICGLALVGCVCARPRVAIDKAIPDRFLALTLDKQKLTGLLGSRVRANSEGFLENLDMHALLAPLNSQSEAEGPVAREYPGLFLEAAADSYEYNHDAQLRSQMDRVATALMAMSPTGDTVARAPSLPEGTLRIERADLVGLLAYHRVTSDDKAYSASQLLASSLLRASDSDTERPPALSNSALLIRLSLVQPMARLYRLSGDKRYLVFSEQIARSFKIPPIAAETSVGTLVDSLRAYTGIAALYELDADAALLQTVQAAWNRIADRQLSVTGLPVVAKQAKPSAGTDSDGCLLAAWVQLTFRLLRITGDNRYGDQLERTVYNQLLAAQDARTGAISPLVPLDGSKLFETRLKGVDGRCMLCVSKAIAAIPQYVWGRYEAGIAINMYTPGRASFNLKKHGTVQIYAEGNYPEQGQVQLHVEPSSRTPARFPLRLRVPPWNDDFQVTAPGGLHLTGHAGDVVVVERDWKSGDTVTLSIALPLKLHYSEERGSKVITLQRGPQVLTLSKTLNPSLTDLGTAAIQSLPDGRFQISLYEDNLPRSWSGDQVYSVSGTAESKALNLLLVPFADGLHYRTNLPFVAR